MYKGTIKVFYFYYILAEILTSIFDRYFDGYVYLNGSRTKNPPIYEEIYFIICDANEILDDEDYINDTLETN